MQAIVAGLDEAGRGALAGPVVAAACTFGRKRMRIPRGVRIADSKILSEEEREEAFLFLTRAVSYGIGIVGASFIDRLGILGATELAMQRALANLQRAVRPTYLLVDGRDKFWFDLPHSSLIDGDQLEPCISASSIIAKVMRDRIMIRSEQVFPGYGFSKHKGYGTAEHKEMIRKHGPCILHRQTFLATLAVSSNAPGRSFPRIMRS